MTWDYILEYMKGNYYDHPPSYVPLDIIPASDATPDHLTIVTSSSFFQ